MRAYRLRCLLASLAFVVSACAGPNPAPTAAVATSPAPSSTATATAEPPPTAAATDSVASRGTTVSVDGPLAITGLDKSGTPESVTVTNLSDGDVDLTGWWILSVRGEQVYAFPAGYVLPAGASVAIYSGPGADATTDGLFWTVKHMWNNSKPDPAVLYNPAGEQVSMSESD